MQNFAIYKIDNENKDDNNLTNINNKNEVNNNERRNWIFVKDSSIKDIILLSVGDSSQKFVRWIQNEWFYPFWLIKISFSNKEFFNIIF